MIDSKTASLWHKTDCECEYCADRNKPQTYLPILHKAQIADLWAQGDDAYTGERGYTSPERRTVNLHVDIGAVKSVADSLNVEVRESFISACEAHCKTQLSDAMKDELSAAWSPQPRVDIMTETRKMLR